MSVYEEDLPKGYKLHPDVNQDVYWAEYYKHWTVRDVIEQLLHMDMDARVWIGPAEWPEQGDVALLPVETVAQINGEVIL